jgi:putative transposase
VRWQFDQSGIFPGLTAGEPISASRAPKAGARHLQRRHWEHTLRDEADFARHVDYIHFNPVKHGYVRRARDWPHSTFHRMVRLGLYPLDWASDISLDANVIGER